MNNQQVVGLIIIGIVGLLAVSANKNLVSPELPSQPNQRSRSLDNAPDATVFISTSEVESQKAINLINEHRKKYGKLRLDFSPKTYKLAVARAKDMNQFDYFGMTNPKTKTCSDTLKTQFGFSDKEFVVENYIRYIPTGANIGAATKSLTDVVAEWLTDTSNGANFIFDHHVAGAVGCDGNKCVFIGLNQSGYRQSCSTQ